MTEMKKTIGIQVTDLFLYSLEHLYWTNSLLILVNTYMTNKKINYEYHVGLDRAKEKQAKSLKDGLEQTRERFLILLKKRFGEDEDILSKADITSELLIFESLEHTDDANREVSYLRAFFQWIRSLSGPSI